MSFWKKNKGPCPIGTLHDWDKWKGFTMPAIEIEGRLGPNPGRERSITVQYQARACKRCGYTERQKLADILD